MRTVTVKVPVTGLWVSTIDVPDDVVDVAQYISDNEDLLDDIALKGYIATYDLNYLGMFVQS